MLKVMTYNIRHGWGINKLFGLMDIYRIIKKHQPDIVGLNEVDVFNPRSLFENQARKLADKLKYNYAFEPNLKIGLLGYGNAIISKFPIVEVKNYPLFSKGEKRGCLYTKLDTEIGKINVLCTHLGLDVKERQYQINQLVNICKEFNDPTLLIGDFNCNQEELLPIKEIMVDALLSCNKAYKLINTYPTVRTIQRLDYIFHNSKFRVLEYKTIYAKVSDHFPVLAKLKLVKPINV